MLKLVSRPILNPMHAQISLSSALNLKIIVHKEKGKNYAQLRSIHNGRSTRKTLEN